MSGSCVPTTLRTLYVAEGFWPVAGTCHAASTYYQGTLSKPNRLSDQFAGVAALFNPNKMPG